MTNVKAQILNDKTSVLVFVIKILSAFAKSFGGLSPEALAKGDGFILSFGFCHLLLTVVF